MRILVSFSGMVDKTGRRRAAIRALSFRAIGKHLKRGCLVVSVAFRIALAQPGNTRVCDDLKYGAVKRWRPPDTPIKRPAWYHIGQIRLRSRHSDRPRALFTADRKASHKISALNPDIAKLRLSPFRFPTDKIRYGLLLRKLFFGDVGAVAR